MIDILRLDERLIHGQVAAGWARVLKSDTLLVVDDAAAADAFITKTLYMAAPPSMKTFVMDYDKAIGVLTDPRCHDRHIFCIVRSIDTLLALAQNAPDIAQIHIANYGHIATGSGEERISYTEPPLPGQHRGGQARGAPEGRHSLLHQDDADLA